MLDNHKPRRNANPAGKVGALHQVELTGQRVPAETPWPQAEKPGFLFPLPDLSERGCGPAVAAFEYRERDGDGRFIKVRFEPGKQGKARESKAIRWHHWSGARWKRGRSSGGETPALRLWHFDEALKELGEDRTLYLAEGEKAAWSLIARGLPATTAPGGAGEWSDEYADAIAAAGVQRVVILQDNDNAGKRDSAKKLASLQAAGIEACIVDFASTDPDFPDKGDAWDFFARGGTLAVLQELIADASSEQAPIPEPALPAPPLHAMPESIARYLQAVAANLHCDPAMVLSAALPILASAIGRKAVVEARQGWQEPISLWLGIVAPPSSKKSPATQALLAPVEDQQRRLSEAFRSELEAWEQEQERRGNLPAKERRELSPPDPRPSARMAIFGESTMEGLWDALIVSDGVLYERDELSGVFGSFDAYRGGRGSDREHFLSIYNARSFSVVRKSRDPVHVARPSLSILGSTQPETLRKIASQFNGDGLLARFSFVTAKQLPRRFDTPPVPGECEAAWAATLQALYSMPARETPLTLSAQARELFQAFHEGEAWDSRNQQGELAAAIAEKLQAIALRVAGVLSLASNAQASEVSAEGMSGAIKLANWLGRHTLQALGNATGGGRESLKAIEVLRKEGGSLPERELIREAGYHGSAKRSTRFKSVLSVLERQGVISRKEETTGAGQKRVIVSLLEDRDT